MEFLGFDRVYLQEMMVPKWVHGEKKVAYFIDNKTKVSIPVCALGSSIATSKNGFNAEVIEVKNLKELEILGEKLKGKIVFFNRPMDLENVETFLSYSGCVDQRFFLDLLFKSCRIFRISHRCKYFISCAAKC